MRPVEPFLDRLLVLWRPGQLIWVRIGLSGGVRVKCEARVF